MVCYRKRRCAASGIFSPMRVIRFCRFCLMHSSSGNWLHSSFGVQIQSISIRVGFWVFSSFRQWLDFRSVTRLRCRGPIADFASHVPQRHPLVVDDIPLLLVDIHLGQGGQGRIDLLSHLDGLNGEAVKLVEFFISLAQNPLRFYQTSNRLNTRSGLRSSGTGPARSTRILSMDNKHLVSKYNH